MWDCYKNTSKLSLDISVHHSKINMSNLSQISPTFKQGRLSDCFMKQI